MDDANAALAKAQAAYFNAIATGKPKTPEEIAALKKSILDPAVEKQGKAIAAKRAAELEEVQKQPEVEKKPLTPQILEAMKPPRNDNSPANQEGAHKFHPRDEKPPEGWKPIGAAEAAPVAAPTPKVTVTPDTPTVKNEPVVSGTAQIDTLEFKKTAKGKDSKSAKLAKTAKKPKPDPSASPDPVVAPSGSGVNVDEVSFEKAKPSPKPGKGKGASKTQ